MKKIVKYASILISAVGAVVLGEVLLKKHVDDYFPVINEDDWL